MGPQFLCHLIVQISAWMIGALGYSRISAELFHIDPVILIGKQKYFQGATLNESHKNVFKHSSSAILQFQLLEYDVSIALVRAKGPLLSSKYEISTMNGGKRNVHSSLISPRSGQPACLFTESNSGVEHDKSVTLVNLCHQGIFGVVRFSTYENDSFLIEPERNRAYHRLIKLESTQTTLKQSQERYFTCKTTDKNWELPSSERLMRPTFLNRHTREANTSKQLFVELYVVADNFFFEKQRSSVVKTEYRIIQALLFLNTVFYPLRVSVVLVGLEVWTGASEIGLMKHRRVAEDVLKQFTAYRTDHIRTHHDSAHFLTAAEFSDHTAGVAWTKAMCHRLRSTAVVQDMFYSFQLVGQAMAHEMAHSFGLHHDRENCACNKERYCLMSPQIGKVATSWSNCSTQSFYELVNHDNVGICLGNIPDKGSPTTCGNHIVEEGEECDHGPPVGCNTKCCHCSTCTFTKGAKCSQGLCCESRTCQFKRSMTPCGSSLVGQCDLPETCTGSSSACPTNYYKADGTVCDKGYCYGGKCVSRGSHCRFLFGDHAGESLEACYEENVLGQKHGHCGRAFTNITHTEYMPCRVSDSLCGQLKCLGKTRKDILTIKEITHLLASGARNAHPIKTIEGSTVLCNYANFDLDPDLGMVPNGSPCGPSKYCVRQRCVPLPVKANCNGHGERNNIGLCHCHSGYGPPYCNVSGEGGYIAYRIDRLEVSRSSTSLDISLRQIFSMYLVVIWYVHLLLNLYGMFSADLLSHAFPCVFLEVH